MVFETFRKRTGSTLLLFGLFISIRHCFFQSPTTFFQFLAQLCNICFSVKIVKTNQVLCRQSQRPLCRKLCVSRCVTEFEISPQSWHAEEYSQKKREASAVLPHSVTKAIWQVFGICCHQTGKVIPLYKAAAGSGNRRQVNWQDSGWRRSWKQFTAN